MAGGGDEVNQATIELLERRITDRVVETARTRVIAYYVAFGSGLSVLATLAGFAAVQWLKQTAETGVQAAIARKTDVIDKQALLLSEQQRKAETAQAVVEELFRQTNRTLADLSAAHRDFAPKAQQLQAINDAVARLEPRVDAIRALPDIADRNSKDIEELGQQLAVLAGQVSALAAVGKDAPQPSPSGPAGGPSGAGGPASRYGDIAASTSQVARQTTGIADSIQAARARPVVYLQFSGFTREVADQLRATLGDAGYTFPPAERIATATGLFEVRYFFAADKEAAERLAAAASQAAPKFITGETRTAKPIDLTSFRGTKPRQGTIELWYGLRS